MRRLVILVATLAVLAVGTVVPAAAGPSRPGDVIPGRFIVQLRDGVDAHAVAAEQGRRGGVEVDHVYTAALRGFAGEMSGAAVARLRADGRVARVEPDRVVSIADTGTEATQAGATWGLDRVDQRDLPLSTTYGYDHDGAGVYVYVLDTGIRADHEEFTNRLAPGLDVIGGDNADGDCRGHGTHVAGTIGGTTWGVAKQVTLVPVRVLGCDGSGSWSGVAKGVDWVTAQHQAANADGVRPSVANMSLGGGTSSTVDAAVANSIASGVTYAVSAGNSSADACNSSPARVPEAVTVGATTSSDSKASYSNYGRCLDLFAPGSSIRSASNGSPTGSTTKSGTSMAAPHVAGVAALHLQHVPTATPGDVASAITGGATSGKLSGIGRRSPNLLLYSRFATTSGGGGGEPAPLQATFTYSCSDATCSFDGTSSSGASSYSWTFDGGTSSVTDATVQYTHAAPGSYQVILTVSDGAGATASATTMVSCSWKGKSGKLGCG